MRVQTYFLAFLLLSLPLLLQIQQKKIFFLLKELGHLSNFAFVVGILHLLLISLNETVGLLYAMLLYAFLVISVFIELVCRVYFNEIFELDTLAIIMETNTREMKEFFNTFIDKKLLAVLFFISFPFLFLQLLDIELFAPYVFLFFLIFSLFSYRSFKIQLKNNVLITFLQTLYRYYEQKKREKRYTIQGKSSFNEVRQSTQFVDTIVIVLGESLNRNRMSLYGYQRDTTPSLDAMYQKGLLCRFEDVICSDASTRLMIPKIFTFFDSNAQDEWTCYENLISIYKHLGYKTHWISNQEKYGLDGGSIASNFAQLCDFSYFNKEENRSEQYDEELLGIFKNLLQQESKKKLFIMHLMGNHFEYKKRYPASFEKFNDSIVLQNQFEVPRKHLETYNAYDNSILYNDYIVSSIIAMIDEKTDDSSLCFYFPDHGEEVCDFRDYIGHNLRLSSAPMAEIPFVLYTSQVYKLRHKKTMKKVENALKTPFTTDYFIHLLLNMTHSYSPEYKEHFSLLDAPSATLYRNFTGLDYDKEVKLREQIKLHEKIWMHRANSLYLLEKAKNLFHGVEIDIYIQDNTLYVTHDRKASALTLQEYCKHLDPEMYLWLDFKNLQSFDATILQEMLLEICEQNSYDSKKLIIESSDPLSLRVLSKIFYTSYYFPYLKDEEFHDKELASRLIEKARSSESQAISFPGYMYNYIQSNILSALGDKEILTWFEHKRVFSDRDDYDFIAKFVKNKQLRALLIGSQERTDNAHKIKLANNIEELVGVLDALNQSKKKVLVYGAGYTAKLLIPYIQNAVGIVDKDPAKVGMQIKGFFVDSIDNIKEMDFECILITVLGREEDISDYLISEIQIEGEKIITLNIKK